MKTNSGNSIQPHDFGAVQIPGRERNRFFWRQNRKHTMDAGLLCPSYRQRCIPGDKFQIQPRYFIRFSSALIKPVMDNATAYVYYFFVPDRIVFPRIRQFFGECGVNENAGMFYAIGLGQDGEDSSGNVKKVGTRNIGGSDMPTDWPGQQGAPNYLDVFTNPKYGLPFVKISNDAVGSSYDVTSNPRPFNVRSIYDYFALPYSVGGDGYAICALPLLAYNKIFNTYFRDENLIAPAPCPFEEGTLTSGSLSKSNLDSSFVNSTFSQNTHIYEDISSYKKGQYLPMDMFKVLPVAKFNDFFTRMLPFQQKGDAISIGLTGTLPVFGANALNIEPTNFSIASNSTWQPYTLAYTGYNTSSSAGNKASIGFASNESGTNALPSLTPPGGAIYGSTNFAAGANTAGSNAYTMQFYPAVNEAGQFVGQAGRQIQEGTPASAMLPFGRAVLDGVQALDVSQLRMGMQLERVLELFARAGTRYDEIIYSMYNVVTSDARIQIPQFLGGFKFLINVNPVVQNSSTVGQVTPLGDLGAFGVGSKVGRSINVYCEEFGTIIGLMCVRTSQSYQQSLHPDWTTTKVSDFYIPTLAHLSEYAYPNRTLCTTGIFDYDNSPFGFLPRYEHYRTAFNEICCEFRSNYEGGSLDIWHYGQFYDTSEPGTAADGYSGLPHLNAQFINQNSEVIDRALTVQSSTSRQPQFLCDITHDVRSIRCVSKYGDPGYVDHF